MKISPDSKIIRKVAEALRERDLDLNIHRAVHQAVMALDLVRDAEYRVQDDYLDQQ